MQAMVGSPLLRGAELCRAQPNRQAPGEGEVMQATLSR